MVTIRNFQLGDELPLWDIFFNTIRTINRKDYSQAQVQAWAPDAFDESAWFKRIRKIKPYIAVNSAEIVGYADVQSDGYIDHFFCHRNYQGKGVGNALMTHILVTAKTQCLPRLYSHVSITAKPFFEHYGFNTTKQQQVEVRGQVLTNFVMERVLQS